ncbi:MAG: hypothetical protein AAGC60_10785 [Acidobacteriota bacterium]
MSGDPETLRKAHDALLLAIGALEMWERRLRGLAERMPDPTLDDIDAPPPMPSAVREQMLRTVDGRLAPAIADLKQAARWMDDEL